MAVSAATAAGLVLAWFAPAGTGAAVLVATAGAVVLGAQLVAAHLRGLERLHAASAQRMVGGAR